MAATSGSDLMSPLQENAFDLHSAGSLLTLATTVDWKPTGAVNNIHLYHCMAFFPLVTVC